MSYSIERKTLNILWGENFGHIQVAEDGTAITFTDGLGEDFIFEAQNGTIVEVTNGGEPVETFDPETRKALPLSEQGARAFSLFEVATVTESEQVLPYLGGKLVTFTIHSDGEDEGYPTPDPIRITLYTRDSDQDVQLVQAFRDDEAELVAKCQPVTCMVISIAYNYDHAKMTLQELVDKDEELGQPVNDCKPFMDGGMNLGDLLASQLAEKQPSPNGSHTLDRADESPLILKTEWRLDA